MKAGLRNAKAKGKKLGRPRLVADRSQIARLRTQGRSLREIAAKLGNMPEIKEIVNVSAPAPQPSGGSGDRPLQSPNTTRTTVNAGSGVDEEAKNMQALLGPGVAA